MELWFTERQTPHLGITCTVGKVLMEQQTDYQHLAVLETAQFGRMLVLDGMIQTTIADEFIYHEMITHVPLMTHPEPRSVLVVGGGDGGAVREAVKHPRVQEVTLVEIDPAVVEASRLFLPEISCALDSPKVKIVYGDGIKFIREAQKAYDVIIVDSPEPVGPAQGLFTRDFYQSVREALKEDGLFTAQTESPFINQGLIREVFASIRFFFPITKLFWANIPTYPGGSWSFTLGSNKFHPLRDLREREAPAETRYYSPEIHRSAFVLPPFVQRLLEGRL